MPAETNPFRTPKSQRPARVLSWKKRRQIMVMVATGIINEGSVPSRTEYELFEKRALDALLLARGDKLRALKHMGIKDYKGLADGDRRKIVSAAFGSKYVVEGYERARHNIEGYKRDILEGLALDAVHAATPEDRHRAASLLARIQGWNKPAEVHVKTDSTHTFHGLVGHILADESALTDFMALTDRKPGPPVAAEVDKHAKPITLEHEPERLTG
jgi:hypothetical protein